MRGAMMYIKFASYPCNLNYTQKNELRKICGHIEEDFITNKLLDLTVVHSDL